MHRKESPPHPMDPPGPPGRIDIVLNREPNSPWVQCLIDDKVVFDYEDRGGWAVVAPGRHKITCESRTKQSFGAVTQFHDVAPGQNLVVYYAPPKVLLFGKGSMGLTPQQPSRELNPREVAFTVIGIVLFAVLIALGAILWS